MLTQNEQYFLELTNAARLDPLGEAERQGIGLDADLAPGTIPGTPVQALAPNARIQEAADAHGQWMLDNDTFSHTGADGSDPGDRIADAGYIFEGNWTWGENISWRSVWGGIGIDLESVIDQWDEFSHKGHFPGLYESAGHRENMFREELRETGVSQTRGDFTQDGDVYDSSMLVNKFGTSGDATFLTGVTYDDLDGNGLYTPGEGAGGFSISANGSATMTWDAGGYVLGLDKAAAVSVTLGAGGSAMEVLVDLSDENVKLDLVNGDRILTSGDITLGAGAGEVGMLGAVDNAVTGNALDNVFHVGRGDNVIEGGGGTDRVVFTGARDDFGIVEEGDGRVLVTDLRDGPEGDGANTLTDISLASFTDEVVSLLPDPEGPADPPWPSTGALLFTFDDGTETLISPDADGAFDLSFMTGLTGRLDAAPGPADVDALTVGDALDVLRLSVGLEPSFGPATPFDLVAADVDRSGSVDVGDALDVLRAAVGLDAEGPGRRVLLDGRDTFEGMSPDNVSYTSGIDVDAGFRGDAGDLMLVTLGDVGATNTV